MAKFALNIEADSAEELSEILGKLNTTPVVAAPVEIAAPTEPEAPTQPAKKTRASKAKAPTPADDDDDDIEDEPAAKPPKKAKAPTPVEDEDDDEEDDDGAEKLRVTLRKSLRTLAAKTDRKTAIKTLGRFAKSVDTVPANKLASAIEAIKEAIAGADDEDDED